MAIFKVKITNDYEQEQNKLKKGMEVEVFTRLPTATIYGGAEIKKSIERKYSIQVNGTGWNTETTLEIKKLDENDLVNLEHELQFIKSEKKRIVKAQLFEEASHVRDYEKEILHKIETLKKNNKMKQELLKIYTERQNDYKRIIELFPDNDLAGPFLISPNEIYSKQPNPLMIIGQETNGWDYNVDDLEKQMKVYEDFNVGFDYYSSPFWNVTRKLEKALGNETYSCAWTNFSKFDVDAGRAHGEQEKEISTLDNLLEKEIEILKPKICILFTGPNFDHRIINTFEGVEFSEAEGFTTRQLSQLKHKNLPELTFRTYHPNYLRRSGMEQDVIEFLTNKIK